MMNAAELAFASPRKLPKVQSLRGRVVVLDVAFASEASGGGFNKITKPFIDGLGDRLAGWIDHHDHVLHAEYAHDPRFILATKAEHGACPEMITPDRVAQIGHVDTIVCHTDFDGLCSAAKWIRKGVEPYPGADDDARAVDTRIGTPSATGQRIDRAIRANPRNNALGGLIVRHLATGLEDASLWHEIDAAGAEFAATERDTRRLAASYVIFPITVPPSVDFLPNCDRLAFLDASGFTARFDKTLLLLLGQERAPIAVVADRVNVSFAARYDSGVNFLRMLDLSGGMPTLISVDRGRLIDALTRVGMAPSDITTIGG